MSLWLLLSFRVMADLTTMALECYNKPLSWMLVTSTPNQVDCHTHNTTFGLGLTSLHTILSVFFQDQTTGLKYLNNWSKVFSRPRYIENKVIIYSTIDKLWVYHHHNHFVPLVRIPWPSLATSPNRSSPLAGLQGYIPYPHIAAVYMF